MEVEFFYLDVLIINLDICTDCVRFIISEAYISCPNPLFMKTGNCRHSMKMLGLIHVLLVCPNLLDMDEWETW